MYTYYMSRALNNSYVTYTFPIGTLSVIYIIIQQKPKLET